MWLHCMWLHCIHVPCIALNVLLVMKGFGPLCVLIEHDGGVVLMHAGVPALLTYYWQLGAVVLVDGDGMPVICDADILHECNVAAHLPAVQKEGERLRKSPVVDHGLFGGAGGQLVMYWYIWYGRNPPDEVVSRPCLGCGVRMVHEEPMAQHAHHS